MEVRLAYCPGKLDQCSPGDKPALLVSYVYLPQFLKQRTNYQYRDWVMDSGAFSAHMSGTKIDLDQYIETCKQLLSEDKTLTEVFSLDVIGDWNAGLRNTEIMWEAGVPAIPTFHIGEPEGVLKHLAKTYPKIALGGVARKRGDEKLTWAKQCFARVWPKRIHGFGFGSAEHILALPFHSVDATNWEIGPCAFGRWNSYGQMSIRGSKQNLRVEIDYFLDLEAQAQVRWSKQMKELQTLGPTIRLAQAGRLGRKSRQQIDG